VNFVVINGDDRDEASSALVERFRVDGIPHLALMTKEGEVKTALIG
jgi:thioredoxin-related protein